MADSLSISSATTGIDTSRWKKLTPQEILREKSKGEDVPSEIVSWAEQMAAFSKIPDNVTYEQVDGDIGVEALGKLGINPEEVGTPEAENAEPGSETETPGAVKEPAKTTESEDEENNIFMNTPPGQAADTKPAEDNDDQTDLTLADNTITTNPEEIRKRKERKGLE